MQSDQTLTLFSTPRLLVRKIVDSDLAAMYSVYSDAKAMQWVGDGRPIRLEECRRWIKKTRENYAQYGYGMSTILLRKDGAVIGFCGLVHPGGQPTAEIKYALSRATWGKGLATEVVCGMLDYAKRELNVNKVIATIAAEHLASQRVAHKSGLRRIRIRQEDDGTSTHVFARLSKS